MYEQYYGFSEDPFRMTPDSKNCFKHASYNYAKTYMQYALYREEGVVVVTGQAGTGKSALVGDLSFSISPTQTLTCTLVCTQLQDEDLIRMIAYGFGIKNLPESESEINKLIETNLLGVRKFGRRPLLIIDEAQNLHLSAFLKLQNLAKLKWNDQHLLQMFLVGQETLHEKLLDPRLEYLHQEVNAVIRLEPLDENSTEKYIKHRLTQVGWREHPLLNESIFQSIYLRSRGLPRLINLICSKMCLYGMTEQLSEIGKEEIDHVLADLTADHMLPAPLRVEQDMLG